MFISILSLVLSFMAASQADWLEDCGKSKYEDAGIEPTVVGGWEARPHEFPWQISMHRLRDSGEFSHSCGGSIINENWILTAAHCVDDPTDVIQIHVGAHNLSEPDDSILEIFDVQEVIVHENWSPAITQNDVALLRLNGSITLSENVAAVCPASSSIDYTGRQSLVSGWGAYNSRIDGGIGGEQEFPDTLQAVQAPVASQEACQEKYGIIGFDITEDMICAGRINETEHDACQGDSGGPLVAFNADTERFELIGVVSTGFGCADRFPGIYARVSYFLGWIDSKIN